MRRFMMVETWSEIMGIQSAVFAALDAEDKAEQDCKKLYEEWKKTQKEIKLPA